MHHIIPRRIIYSQRMTMTHSQKEKKEVGSFFGFFGYCGASLCNTKLSVGRDRVSDRVGKEGRKEGTFQNQI